MRNYSPMGLVSQVAVEPCLPTASPTGLEYTVSLTVGIKPQVTKKNIRDHSTKILVFVIQVILLQC
jgi:hypothetical protein